MPPRGSANVFLPQTRHKPKNTEAENGGFLRVAAGRLGGKKRARTVDSVN